MINVREAIENQASPLQATLDAGIEVISNDQEIVFTQYDQLVLPADGFIFWVKTQNTMNVKGSFHFSGDQNQNEDETLGMSHVIFTSESEINDFTNISPTTMWIGTFNNLRFAFNHKKNFYQQASLWHYVGDAIYAAMASQFIDTEAGFDEITPVVSNSLPIWLSLNQHFPMYPSFSVPANITPPYASVHIEPSKTTAIQSVPIINLNSSSYQLASDDIRITIYGARNDDAINFVNYVYDYILQYETMGLLSPVSILMDEKRTQSEYAILAIKKVFSPRVSYYQSVVNAIARKLILHAKINYYPKPD